MLGLDMLDVAIGLALVFFVFSLAVTAAKEALEAGLRYRARDLEKGIRELLDDPEGNKLAAAFYDHPLIYSLYRGGDGGTKRVLPSYIPARNFALAVADLVSGPGKAPDHQKPTDRVVRAVGIAIRAGGDDPDRVRAELEAWYDSAMDRVSGWYKRRTQIIVLALAFVMSVAAHVDTIAIFRALETQPKLREALVEQAKMRVQAPLAAPESAQDAPDKQLAALEKTSLPIGWSEVRWNDFKKTWNDKPIELLGIFVGWLLTAFAVMLGSPFWFDVLNRLMVIRSTVKPHEKSPEEASEDKQKATKKRHDAPSAPPPAATLTPQAPTGSSLPVVGVSAPHSSGGVGMADASLATAAVEDDADEHEDGCLCDHAIDAKDETVDHDLPPATGGVAAAR